VYGGTTESDCIILVASMSADAPLNLLLAQFLRGFFVVVNFVLKLFCSFSVLMLK
jgi:hypothetical protein